MVSILLALSPMPSAPSPPPSAPTNQESIHVQKLPQNRPAHFAARQSLYGIERTRPGDRPGVLWLDCSVVYERIELRSFSYKTRAHLPHCRQGDDGFRNLRSSCYGSAHGRSADQGLSRGGKRRAARP